MAYGTPTDPVGGTIITVAYAVSNILDPIRWLRLMTGNADPPGSSYVVVSDSTTGTTWRKIPSDALAAGVAVANLGYTPVNRAGDTGMSGNFTTTGVMTALGLVAGVSGISTTGPVSPTSYLGGSTSQGSPSFRGASIGADGISSAGQIATSGGAGISSSGGVTATGAVSGGSYAGGSTAAGTPSFLGASVGAGGISSAGPVVATGTSDVIAAGAVSGARFSGGSTGAGTPSFLGASVGANGISTAGQVASTLADGTTPPFIANVLQAGVTCTNVKAADSAKLNGVAASSYARKDAASDFTTAPTINGHIVWHDGNDGAGSGLDADLLDGISSAGFAAASHAHSANGSYAGNNGGNRVISNALGFQPRMVVISTPNQTATALRDNVFRSVADGASTGSLAGGSLDASGFTVPSGLNLSGTTYTWSAFA